MDTRLDVVAGADDDRTDEEISNRNIPPRYGLPQWYISDQAQALNDVRVEYDHDACETLIKAGVNKPLAVLLSQQISRPPIVLFKESLKHAEDANFCELLASSQWPCIKLKLPPTANDTNLGWRIEVRPMEAQLTDFENAAYTAFIGLLARTMLAKRSNFTIPMSKLMENLERSKKINAVLEQKFYFPNKNGSVVEASIDEIMNGDQGLIPTMREFLHENANKEEATGLDRLAEYLDLIQGRANGKYYTLARWMREFVRNHPNYQQDSVATRIICYDLLDEMRAITGGKRCEKLGLISLFC